jgi:hypothetical protein
MIAFLAVLLVGVGGCQAIAQKATEKAVQGATGGAVNVNGDTVTLKGTDGSQATIAKETSIPNDFPSDVPLYANGTVTAVVTNETPQGKGYLVGIKYKDDTTTVLDWYNAEFKKGDWKVLSTVTTGDGGMISAENGTYSVTIVITKESSDGYLSSAQMTVGPATKK